jgi:hypothetical protein
MRVAKLGHAPRNANETCVNTSAAGGIQTMNSWTAVLVVAVVLLVMFGIVWTIFQRNRSRALRARFGPEYERMLGEHGSRRTAEKELAQRQSRVDHLSLRPLPPDLRNRYAEAWTREQARFVDEPKAAVSEADHLVEEVMRERGYPVGAFDQQVADVSVDHPRVVENYRAAHEIAQRHERGQANTEDLRKAMVYYRDLFRELLDDQQPLPAGERR